MERKIDAIRLPGLVPYGEALQLQDERRIAVEEMRASEAVFLLQHSPVITLGRNAHETNLLHSREALATMDVDVCETNRGGDVTYHGPGQLVVYPILNLQLRQPSIRWYLRALEEVLIRTLGHFGLAGERVEGFTGVWVRGAKVAAIGVGVHNWVTFHGLALNVDPNMDHFGLIIPCGIADKPVSSLAALLGNAPDLEEVTEVLLEEFWNHLA